jgi:hypothetical protein
VPWWEDLRERNHLEYLSIYGRTILILIFNKWNVEAWTGFIWLKIGTGSRLT